MGDITKLLEVLTLNHKEQMEELARRHQEQMIEQDRRHKEQMDEQARQSREQDRKHAEQIAVLINQVKVRNAEMKHFIETACGGAKANPSPVASFQPFDASSKLQLDFLERFRTFLTANSIP